MTRQDGAEKKREVKAMWDAFEAAWAEVSFVPALRRTARNRMSHLRCLPFLCLPALALTSLLEHNTALLLRIA